jgi:hypothetical protein
MLSSFVSSGVVRRVVAVRRGRREDTVRGL